MEQWARPERHRFICMSVYAEPPGDWTVPPAEDPLQLVRAPMSAQPTAARRSRRSKPMTPGPEPGLHPVGDPDRAEDAGQVGLYGLPPDLEAASHLLFREGVPPQPEHLAFAVPGDIQRVGSALGSEHRPCRPRIERRFAAGGCVDAANELLGLGVLQQIADGAGAQRLDDPLPVHERGQDDHLDAGSLGRDPAGRLDASDAGHREVHEHDVGSLLDAERDGCLAVADGADDLEIGMRTEQRHEPVSDDGVVVDDCDAYHVADTSRSTSVPEPGFDVTVSVPPADSARSRSSARPRCPPARLVCTSSPSNPRPSSATRRLTVSPVCVTRTVTLHAAACAPALRIASCAVRKTSCSISAGVSRPSSTSTVTLTPRATSGATASGSAEARPWSRSAGG